MIDLTRRAFIGRAAATAAALALPIDLRRASRTSPSQVADNVPCAIVDLGDPGLQRESIAGFESALKTMSIPFVRSRPAPETVAVIVPAALRLPSRLGRWLVDDLENGATVIFESGAVFARARSRELRDHQDMLRDLFAIGVDAPAPLWPADGAPYVEYSWPVNVHVRDFSRVLPVMQHAGEVIGRAARLPVAIHQCQGRGTLIFLGSPLGPALWSGDAEARRWLFAGLGTRA